MRLLYFLPLLIQLTASATQGAQIYSKDFPQGPIRPAPALTRPGTNPHAPPDTCVNGLCHPLYRCVPGGKCVPDPNGDKCYSLGGKLHYLFCPSIQYAGKLDLVFPILY